MSTTTVLRRYTLLCCMSILWLTPAHAQTKKKNKNKERPTPRTDAGAKPSPRPPARSAPKGQTNTAKKNKKANVAKKNKKQKPEARPKTQTVLSPEGVWEAIDPKTKARQMTVRLAFNNKKLEGAIVGLPTPKAATLRCTACRGKNKGKLLLGMKVVTGLTKKGKLWSGGQILTPSKGKLHPCQLWLSKDGQSLKIRRYIFFFFYTETWKRRKEKKKTAQIQKKVQEKKEDNKPVGRTKAPTRAQRKKPPVPEKP